MARAQDARSLVAGGRSEPSDRAPLFGRLAFLQWPCRDTAKSIPCLGTRVGRHVRMPPFRPGVARAWILIGFRLILDCNFGVHRLLLRRLGQLMTTHDAYVDRDQWTILPPAFITMASACLTLTSTVVLVFRPFLLARIGVQVKLPLPCPHRSRTRLQADRTVGRLQGEIFSDDRIVQF